MRRVNQAVRAALSMPVGSTASYVNSRCKSARLASGRETVGIVYKSHTAESRVSYRFAATASATSFSMGTGMRAAPWASIL